MARVIGLGDSTREDSTPPPPVAAAKNKSGEQPPAAPAEETVDQAEAVGQEEEAGDQGDDGHQAEANPPAAIAAVPDPDSDDGEHLEEGEEAPAKEATARATKKTTKRATAKAGAKPAAKTTPVRRAPAPEAHEIEVRSVATSEGKKVSIYFHPDDYRDLLQAKVDVGADFQALLRSMVALWREDPRFHSKVNRLAQRAPRGGQR